MERRPDPTDGRARLVYLTDRVKPLLDRLAALAAETRRRALAGMAPDEQERIVDALRHIRANLRPTCQGGAAIARRGDTPAD